MKIEEVKRKCGMRYRVRFSIRYTNFVSPWFKTRDEAKDWAAFKRTEVANGQACTGAAITLRKFAEMWLEKHAFAKKTFPAALRDKQSLTRHILPRLGNTKLRALTNQNITFLFSDLYRRSGLSPRTVNNMLGTLKKVLSDAVRWGYLSRSPAADVTRFKAQEREVEIFTPDEVQRLLAFAKDEYPEEYLLIVFALNTGCRLGEIVALRWSKVDLAAKFVMIDATYEEKTKQVVARTKGKRFRKVPLNETCISIIRQMVLDGRKAESEFVFHRISYYAVTHQKFRRILKRGGLADALARRKTFHCLRHTFASEFMRTGGRLSDLQLLLGHSTIKQTEKYVHFAPDYLVGATQRIAFVAPEGAILPLAARLA